MQTKPAARRWNSSKCLERPVRCWNNRLLNHPPVAGQCLKKRAMIFSSDLLQKLQNAVAGYSGSYSFYSFIEKWKFLLNYAHKYLTRQKFYEHKYSYTCRISSRVCFKSIILEPAAHVEYLGKYVFNSIILEPVVPNSWERVERARLWRGNTLGFSTSGNEWEVSSLAFMPLGHLYRQWLFTCGPLEGLDFTWHYSAY